MTNLYANLPKSMPNEVFEDIVSTSNLRIERILSYGHSSPEVGWYDQSENEWVLVLKGQGVLEFEDGRTITLSEGDHININAGVKHKVQSTTQIRLLFGWLCFIASRRALTATNNSERYHD